MESICWLLVTTGVEFEEEFLETREQYEKLQKDGCLLFGRVPLVEIDGMLLTQTRAILRFLAAKHNLYGKNLKDRAFKTRISNIPTIKKFLQPGSQRKPPPDGHYDDMVRTVLKF
ncbi:uncharacterized protein LOC688925 [Rattus norvegicus]|uniref:glutathione transferase n=1 Tax=Rattus norvegicus TaxID=10116 RepID=Q6TUG1_RAT|nr:uncharacterized protein LOC688925 [Rattus norvegicus]AAQ91039.1 LRRGT00083 [Rattus norvegicus]|eukprot:NP_001257315.1 uncharacterized protein LOC688925 [Rattus norvegicus]